MIRSARFGDVPAMLAVLRDGYERSVFAGKVAFDDKEANAVLCQAIQRHGSKSAAGTWVQVAEHDGAIEGLIVGALQRVYLIGAECMATDLFWLTTKKCPARDGVALVMGFVDWAKAHPKVAEIQCGATAALGDPARAAKILGKLGMSPFGTLHRMEVAR